MNIRILSYGLKALFALIFVFFTTTAFAEDNLPVYSLSVSFDPDKGVLYGKAEISLEDGRDLLVSFGDLKVISTKFNNQEIPPDDKLHMLKIQGKGIAEIVYEADFSGSQEAGSLQNAGVANRNIIGSKGISLTRMWYPAFEGMAYYKLKALIPKGFIAVSEAEEIETSNTDKGRDYIFHFPHPLTEITLAASNYKEHGEYFDGIRIYAYLFSEDDRLAGTYLNYTKKFLQMYKKMFGKYPYRRFSVVENFQSTGYSMPTYTLLGQDVVRLPFIAETALGHEVLHQWFGNHVYVDYSKGNWAEGLTSYLSDHLYEDQKGNSRQHRKNILSDYLSYVNSEKEFPLKEFSGRTDFASKAIGYGKSAMVFHMLKKLAGEDKFYSTLEQLIKDKAFQYVSWEDIRGAFEKTSGLKLEAFFRQWLDRKGLSSPEIAEPAVKILNGVQTVVFKVRQKDEPYIIDMPVDIITSSGTFRKNLHIEKAKEIFEIPVEGNPLELVIDPEYDIARKLSEEEYPPLIAGLLGSNKRLVVIPENEKDKYQKLVETFKAEGFSTKNEVDVNDEDIRSSSLLVLGTDGRVLKRLFGSGMKNDCRGFSLEVKKNPLNTKRVVAAACAESGGEAEIAARKIFHYGKYSSIRFINGKNTEKKTNDASRGIRFPLNIFVKGIQPKKTLGIEEIIEQIKFKSVIHVGERHENYEDHKIQLKIIMGLHEKGRKIAIGMEMFQRPFQKSINDYLAGSISEKQFLKSTEYYKRWQFDYNLYREIIEYAKAKNIPVLALNQWTEITKKVAREGLDGLDFTEKREIPENMDMSDESYNAILKEVFSSHRTHENRNFEYFVQSQILWDETMAHTAAEFMAKNPDYQMVVLAGMGHIMYGAGIPKRIKRLNGKDFVTLIPASETADEDIADFVLFPEHVQSPSAMKLGLVLKETDSGVKIEEIIPGSRVKNSGLKKGDILVTLDEWKIEDINDVKIFMFDKKEGETIKIKAKRKKFLSGYQTMEFTAVL